MVVLIDCKEHDEDILPGDSFKKRIGELFGPEKRLLNLLRSILTNLMLPNMANVFQQSGDTH